VARSPSTFKQRDVTQALKGALAAGIRISRCEIDREGKIVVVAANDDALSTLRNPNGWEDIK